MRKSLFLLSALLLTGIGAWAQGTTAYEFKAENWVGVSGRSADSGQVTYSDNTITVNVTGNNNIALFNGSGESSINTTGYYITSEQKYFVVVGSDLNTSNTDNTYSQLWWMNGYNYGLTAKPDYVVELTDENGNATGEVLFAWDCSSYLTAGADGNITLNGWTGFGLTTTGTSSTISYIGFYTEDELNALLTTKPYVFKAEDWVALGDHAETTATPNAAANTITVTYTGDNAGLGNMGTMAETGANTAGYYVTKEQHWFVIQGTAGLSTSGNVLWFMNYYNNGMTISPTETATLTDGSVVLAWDLSKSQAGTNLQNDMNTLSGGTCFGLIANEPTTGFTITDINFYTEAEVEELISSAIKPYEFNASDWVALGDHTGTTVKANEDGTISVTYTDTEAGLSNSGTAYNDDTTLGITTGKYYVTKDQCWFVIIGKGLSTNNSESNYDSQLWWMNGANYGTWYPTTVETLSDGQVLIAWDLSTMPEIDVNLQDDSDLLDGWTCFGLKAANHSNGGSFTISDINFYTADEVKAIQTGASHYCEANDSHWTLTRTGSDTNGTLQLDTWATQNDDDMSVPFMEYYVAEGADKNVTLSAATISHEQLTLEPGKYKVSMDIRIIEYDTGSINDGTKFKANDVEEDLLDGVDGTDGTYGTGNDAPEDLFGTYTLYVEITDDKNTLNISLTIPEDANYSWIMWKNLTVTAIEEEPTVSWEMQADYGTLMLPFACTLAEGLTAYTISEVSDNEVTLEVASSIEAGVPYIIGGTASTTAITFTGMPTAYNVSYTSEAVSGASLTGVQKATTAPAGSYVLQMQDGDTTPAFYLVAEEGDAITVGAYHCYLNYTATAGAKLVVYFPDSGVATAIDAVETADDAADSETVYDLSGRRVAKAQKGVYIVNGKKMVIK